MDIAFILTLCVVFGLFCLHKTQEQEIKELKNKLAEMGDICRQQK